MNKTEEIEGDQEVGRIGIRDIMMIQEKGMIDIMTIDNKEEEINLRRDIEKERILEIEIDKGHLQEIGEGKRILQEIIVIIKDMKGNFKHLIPNQMILDQI